MALVSGARLGPYEIQSVLGAGGMGEVYRARDTRLDRVVAIKVLPHGVADDPQRRERFDREARAISSLNHPHICTLHDVGHQDGTDYLVMELLDGQTLAERLQKGPVPIEQAIQYAIEIADALSAAHRRSIVHRDLKPANVMLTKSGAKLLDFGIAKAVDPGEVAATAPQTLTAEGTLLGTPQYMAPEQLEGREADARSDLFAFGAVVYEMLTGRRAFSGESQSKVIAAVLDSDPPPIATVQPLTTPALDQVVRTCLAKNPDDRWQNASDLKRQLEWVAASAPPFTAPAGGGPGSRVRTRGIRAATLAALVVFITGAALAWAVWMRRATPTVLQETRLEISTPPTTQPYAIAISPDGLTVAFVAESGGQPMLWVRPLNAVAARPLEGTAGAGYPFWSPDNHSLGFFAGGKLKRIEIKGGAPQTLADALQPHGGTWTTDGAIVFTPHQLSPLLRLSAGGGEPVAVTKLSPGQLGHLFPQVLPDGIHVLYFVSGASDLRGIYFGRLDGTAAQRLMAALSPALYVPTGHLLFVREQALFAQAFDPARIKLEGSAVRVAERLAVGSGVAASEPAAMSASNAGDILYRSVAAETRRQLTWLDRSGKAVAQVGGSDAARTRTGIPISLSPDGRRVSVVRVADGKTDLWLVDLERTGTMNRFTFSGDNTLGLWSRDGLRLTFGSTRNGRLDLYQRAIDGDREEPLLVTPRHKAPVDWSPDGSVLLYLDAEPTTHLDVWALPVGAGEKPFPLIRSPYEDLNPQFSPDGAWVAYQSDVSTRHEVYVRPFRGAGEAVLISTAGGTQPRWRRDGRELFYLGLDRRLMAVPIAVSSSGRPVEAGIPVPLFQTRIGGPGIAQREYEVSPDGQRFLMDAPVDEASAPIILIQYWRP